MENEKVVLEEEKIHCDEDFESSGVRQIFYIIPPTPFTSYFYEYCGE